jgi:hypothetical protein
MTYILTATKQHNRYATVSGRFRYEENILFPGSLNTTEEQWAKIVTEVHKSKEARAINIRDAIRGFLESRYDAKGLKDYPRIGHMDFVLTNHDSRQKRGYHAIANETTYDVEVSGMLREGEHLEDMLDCAGLDKLLKEVSYSHYRAFKRKTFGGKTL